MKIGEIEIKWDMGYESAADLLEAIQVVCGSRYQKLVRNDYFTVEKMDDGRVVVTIENSFYVT